MERRKIVIGLLVGAFLILLGVMGRLLPHPPNFAPIAAISLFAGFFFKRKLLAALLPLSAILIGDFFIGTYNIKIAVFVYLFLIIPVFFGAKLQKNIEKKKEHNMFLFSSSRLFGFSLLGSTLFFIASNFAVWLWAGLYTKTFSGLMMCYVMALPFFEYTLLGDLCYTFSLFGIYYVVNSVFVNAQIRDVEEFSTVSI